MKTNFKVNFMISTFNLFSTKLVAENLSTVRCPTQSSVKYFTLWRGGET